MEPTAPQATGTPPGRRNWPDVIMGLVWMAFGLVLLFVIIPAQISRAFSPGLPPDAFPRAVATLMVALGAMLTVGSFGQRVAHWNSVQELVSRSTILRLLAMVALTVLYIRLIEPYGFYRATLAVFPLVLLLYGERRWLPIAMVTVGMLLFIYVLFETLLRVRL